MKNATVNVSEKVKTATETRKATRARVRQTQAKETPALTPTALNAEEEKKRRHAEYVRLKRFHDQNYRMLKPLPLKSVRQIDVGTWVEFNWVEFKPWGGPSAVALIIEKYTGSKNQTYFLAVHELYTDGGKRTMCEMIKLTHRQILRNMGTRCIPRASLPQRVNAYPEGGH